MVGCPSCATCIASMRQPVTPDRVEGKTGPLYCVPKHTPTGDAAPRSRSSRSFDPTVRRKCYTFRNVYIRQSIADRMESVSLTPGTLVPWMGFKHPTCTGRCCTAEPDAHDLGCYNSLLDTRTSGHIKG
jgi:hypothetical protein